jgi:polysaccharide chain length determinant protein (PEP-CTERM system associated)
METNGAAQGLSVFTLLKAIKRRKLYLLIPVLLLTAGAGIYALRLPERFRARALIAAEPVIPAHYFTDRVDAAAAANVQEQLRAVRETLFSPPVLENVARQFKLYDLVGERGPGQAMEEMKSRISVQVEGPDTFSVGFEGENRQQVTQVANRLAELFIQRTADLGSQRAAQADSFLDTEVERLRNQVTEQEESLKTYKQGAVQELPERLTTNLKLFENLQQQVQSKTDQITEGQARRSATIEEIKALEKQGALDSPEQPRERSTALEDLRLKLRRLKAQYTAKYPEVEQTEKEIRDLESIGTPAGHIRGDPSPVQMRYFALQAELKSIDLRLKSYQQERNTLESEMKNYERRINSSPGYETALGQRMRDAAITRTRYEALFARQQETKLDQRAKQNNKDMAFKIIEAAQLPSAPYSPHRRRILLMGFLASLALGLIAVLSAEQMDTSFDTIEGFQNFTNLPVLSAVPTIPGRAPETRPVNNGDGALSRRAAPKLEDDGFTAGQRRDFQQRRLPVIGDPQSASSEQYGILSLKIQQWMNQSNGRVLLVTSAAGGEGKSVTAVNLSLVLSSSLEGRVLLLDGDLRRPQVHKHLGLNPGKGFSDLLSQPGVDINSYISKFQDLYVIAGGAEPVNPVGLLASRRAAEILARLRNEFQFIVLDSPPIVPIADSHILAGLADGVVIVIRARHTPRELFRRAIESLSASNVLGIVLNDVEYGDTRYGYAYEYYQRHNVGRS